MGKILRRKRSCWHGNADWGLGKREGCLEVWKELVSMIKGNVIKRGA